MEGWILLGKIKKVSSKYPWERSEAKTFSCCGTGSRGRPSTTKGGICLMGLNASGTSL